VRGHPSKADQANVARRRPASARQYTVQDREKDRAHAVCENESRSLSVRRQHNSEHPSFTVFMRCVPSTIVAADIARFFRDHDLKAAKIVMSGNSLETETNEAMMQFKSAEEWNKALAVVQSSQFCNFCTQKSDASCEPGLAHDPSVGKSCALQGSTDDSRNCGNAVQDGSQSRRPSKETSSSKDVQSQSAHVNGQARIRMIVKDYHCYTRVNGCKNSASQLLGSAPELRRAHLLQQAMLREVKITPRKCSTTVAGSRIVKKRCPPIIPRTPRSNRADVEVSGDLSSKRMYT